MGNIARKIFGIKVPEPNNKVYDPAVTRGDLVRYDEELTLGSITGLADSAGVLYNDGFGNLSWVPGGGGGIASLNGLVALAQTFATGVAGTDFGISSAGSVHTFNLPVASALNTGKLSSTDWSVFNAKQPGSAVLTAISGLSNAAGVLTNDGAGNLSWSPASGGGISTIGTLDSVAKSANGAVISGSNLILQTADSSNPGLVSTGTQTFAGSKTFSSLPTFSSLTPGSVVFAGTGGLIAQDNANFFWDDANNRLGIGTATPGGSIDILGTSSAGGVILARIKNITATGEATWTILNDQNDPSGFTAFGSTYAFTAWRRKGAFISSSPTGTAIINFNQTAGADFSIWTQATPTTEKFRLIGSNGNVIIQNGGTFTDAGFRLDVNGTARVQERLTISDDSTVTTETCAVITTDTTNANLVIAPNGTGALIADIPDGTAAGGNARGDNAVDLQTSRTANTQVASGTEGAVIVGGINNTCSGTNSSVCVGGRGNTSSGARSVVVGGTANVASASNSCVVSGDDNLASAGFSSITGGTRTVAYLWGQRANASGRFAANSDTQTSSLTFFRSITGTGIAELTLDGAAPSSQGRAVISIASPGPTNARAWSVIVQVMAIVATQGAGTAALNECFAGTYQCAIKRVGTTTSMIGNVTPTSELSDTNMVTSVVTIDADDTNEALRIQFTPPTTAAADTVIRVVATAYLTEVGR